MILTQHGMNSINRYSIYVDGPTIGGRKYKAVKIKNQIWLVENLDYKFDVNGRQIPVGVNGTPSTPAAWYYNNDENTYGINGTYKCGLLYNWYAVDYLNTNRISLLPDGWRVPSNNDFVNLSTSIGGIIGGGTKLKAKDNSVFLGFPSGWGGNDKYKFKALPCGRYDAEGFALLNEYCLLWANDSYSTYYGWSVNIGRFDDLIIGNNAKLSGRTLRLVKDA